MSAKKTDPRVTHKYKQQRLKILHRDNWVCFYCGGDATQVDHIIPIIKGGDPYDLDNMVAACRRCNISKGSRSQGFFLRQTSTPPVFQSLSPLDTVGTVQSGPCMGQPEQGQTA